MEIYWRRSPVERVVSAIFIPQLKAASDFTQNACHYFILFEKIKKAFMNSQ